MSFTTTTKNNYIKFMFWIGLHQEGSAIKWAKIRKNKGQIIIEQLQTLPLSDDVKQFYFTKDARSDSSITAVFGINTSHILVRNFTLKVQEKKKISKAISFQLEAHIPYPLEEGVVAFQTRKIGNKETEIAAFATKKIAMQETIDKWQKLGIEADKISCAPAALARYANYFYPHLESLLLFDINSEGSSAIYIENKKLIFSHVLPVCLDEEKDEKQQRSALVRFFSFLEAKIKKNDPTPIVVTGSHPSRRIFQTFLKEACPSVFFFYEEPVLVNAYDTNTLASYALSIGLALDGLLLDGLSIAFHEANEPSTLAKKRKYKAFFSLSFSVLVLTIGSVFLEKMYLHQKQANLAHSYQKVFSVPMPSSLEETQIALHKIEDSSRKNSPPYPLSSSLPLVSQTIAYFSEFPPFFEINKLEYSLVKYPNAEAKKDPFIGKISLTVQFESPGSMNRFEKEVLQNCPFFEKKKGLTKEVQGNLQHISFFLKPTAELYFESPQ